MADLTPRQRPEQSWNCPVETVARRLIGATLLFRGVGGRVVETEAYHRLDPASHSFAGQTGRNAAMFGPVGHVYVYRSYGLHWCFNIVAGAEPGAAILIRALEPQSGLELMRARRSGLGDRQLCSGPGKLCQALAITGEQTGAALDRPPFVLVEPPLTETAIVVGPRIGVGKAVDTPWRFGLAGSPWLSRPFPRG